MFLALFSLIKSKIIHLIPGYLGPDSLESVGVSMNIEFIEYRCENVPEEYENKFS